MVFTWRSIDSTACRHGICILVAWTTPPPHFVSVRCGGLLVDGLQGLVADRRILREIDREELRRKRDLEDKEMAKQRERSVSRDRNHSSKEKDHGHRHSSKSKRSACF